MKKAFSNREQPFNFKKISYIIITIINNLILITTRNPGIRFGDPRGAVDLSIRISEEVLESNYFKLQTLNMCDFS